MVLFVCFMVTLVGVVTSYLSAWKMLSISWAGSEILPEWFLRINKIETSLSAASTNLFAFVLEIVNGIAKRLF